MAVDAVCGELVSAMNSLVSGNFAGKLAEPAPHAPYDSHEIRRFYQERDAWDSELKGLDQGKALSFQRKKFGETHDHWHAPTGRMQSHMGPPKAPGAVFSRVKLDRGCSRSNVSLILN
jgi:hypothetical protein